MPTVSMSMTSFFIMGGGGSFYDKDRRPPIPERLLNLQLLEELLHRVCRLLQCGALLIGQLDLDDLLDAVAAELDRHAHVKIVEPVFALQVCGAGEDLP